MIGNILGGTMGKVAPSGDFESIATVSVTSSQAAIEFTSIPSTYQHLQVRFIGRTTSTGTGSELVYFRANGVSSNTSYTRHDLLGNGSTVYAQGTGSGNSAATFYPDGAVNNGATANTFAANIVDILDYKDTNKNKTVRILHGADMNGSGVVGLTSMLFLSTSAITSLYFAPVGTNWNTYTHAALYGIKG